MKLNFLKKAVLGLVCVTGLSTAKAQDIHFTQFDAAPLVINPAFAGAYDGMYRASIIYRNQWNSVTVPFLTYAATFDAPLTRDASKNDYFAAGMHMYNDRSGDGNLTNLTASGTLAYHKSLNESGSMKISMGVQGAYSQKSIDLARLYWGDEFTDGGFQPGTTGEQLRPKTQYFTGSAGLAWSHQAGGRVAYQLGVAGHNLNQPRESLLKKANNEVGLGMRINAQAGANIMVDERFHIRPAVLYQTQTSATEIIAGTELLYVMGQSVIVSDAASVFGGVWSRFGDAIMVTGGLQLKGFRLGVSYDMNNSSLKAASNGQGGFELSLRYVKPNPLDFARRVIFPCSRF